MSMIAAPAPHLFGDERRLFDRVLASGHARYQEFGLGGSTACAVEAGFDTIVAVDSDPAWVASVRARPAVAAAISSGVASVLHADIGPVGDWGAPSSPAYVARWPSYVAVAWAEWAHRGELPDLIYVDGRFRVACCLSALLACAGDADARSRLRILIHDFDDRRPPYRPILDHFRAIDREGSLVLLRAREDAGGPAILTALLAHQFRPD